MEKPRRRWQDNMEWILKKHGVYRIFLFHRNTHSNSKRGEEFLGKLSSP